MSRVSDVLVNGAVELRLPLAEIQTLEPDQQAAMLDGIARVVTAASGIGTTFRDVDALRDLTDEELTRLVRNVLLGTEEVLTQEEIARAVSAFVMVSVEMRVRRNLLGMLIDGELVTDDQERVRLSTDDERIAITKTQRRESPKESVPEVADTPDEPVVVELSTTSEDRESLVEIAERESQPEEALAGNGEVALPGARVATVEEWARARRRYESEGQTVAEIARALNCSQLTVHNRKKADGWEAKSDQQAERYGRCVECNAPACAYSTDPKLCSNHYRESKVERVVAATSPDPVECPDCEGLTKASPCVHCGAASPLLKNRVERMAELAAEEPPPPRSEVGA